MERTVDDACEFFGEKVIIGGYWKNAFTPCGCNKDILIAVLALYRGNLSSETVGMGDAGIACICRDKFNKQFIFGNEFGVTHFVEVPS